MTNAADKDHLQAVLAHSPFLVAQGLRLVALDGQRAVFELDQRPEHGNSDGRLHGGLIATMLDAACGFPARITGPDLELVNAVTLSLTIDYIRAPAPDGTVRATGEVIGGGHKIVFCRGELRDADGTLAATASGNFKRLRGRKPGQISKGQTQ